MLKDFTKEKFDIVILAGQSNAFGSGVGLTDKPFTPNNRVWCLYTNMTISQACEDIDEYVEGTLIGHEARANLALEFCTRYIDEGLLEEGRSLLIVKCALGGLSFRGRDWCPGDPFQLLLDDMTETALQLNPENRVVAFLWHQGESDCGATYEEHYGNLRTLIDDYKAKFGLDGLPFIAGDLVQEWSSRHLDETIPVVSAIRAVCADVGGRFVETDGLPSTEFDLEHRILFRDDKIHFSRHSLYVLGDRYFDAFCEIIGKK